jgi:hypothetical protein
MFRVKADAHDSTLNALGCFGEDGRRISVAPAELEDEIRPELEGQVIELPPVLEREVERRRGDETTHFLETIR